DGEINTQELPSDQCKAIILGKAEGQSRSTSPQKRKIRDESTATNDGESAESNDEDENRGRKRKRSFDNTSSGSSFGRNFWGRVTPDTEIDGTAGCVFKVPISSLA